MQPKGWDKTTCSCTRTSPQGQNAKGQGVWPKANGCGLHKEGLQLSLHLSASQILYTRRKCCRAQP